MNKLLALVLMAVALVFASCSKDNNSPAVPTQKEIETKIIGKWKRTTENGEPVATNRSSVLTYNSDGTSTRSYYYYDASINKSSWYAKSPMSYTLDGNQMCEKELVSGFYTDVYLYSEILSISDNEFNVLNTKRLFDGKEEVVNQNRTYTRVTKDYSKDIIGMWRGVKSSNDTYGNSDHYWLYREDGTYSYFTKNENGQWGTFDNNIFNEYTVDGDWLATHWVTSDSTDNCECWNIDKIEGDHMYWSAIREQDGKLITSTFELERAHTDPTGVVDDILGKMWSAIVRYADGKPITEKEFGVMTGTWQSKDFHTNSILQFNNDGTVLSYIDGSAKRLLYTIKDGEIYTSSATGTEGKMTYDSESDMLIAESEMVGKKFVTVYQNASNDIADDINSSIQGGWTGMTVAFDGVVHSPDAFEPYIPYENGQMRSRLHFQGDQYDYSFNGNKDITGTTKILPTGQIEIGDKTREGSHLMLYYRSQGDVLQAQEFEVGGKLCSVIFERIINTDFSQPFPLVGTWKVMGTYDGVLTSNPTLSKNLKRMLPYVPIFGSEFPLIFNADGTGTITTSKATLTFDYTIEDKSPLLYICCKHRETDAITTVWANKATGNIYLYGPDIDGTGRKVVMSYQKQ